MKHDDLLETFWTLLDSTPLNPLQASYFAKVNIVLLTKQTGPMLSFLRSQPHTVAKLLRHTGCSAISDLILKLISINDSSDGKGSIAWLAQEGLIPHLFDQLDPCLVPDVHTNAAQILMDIISISSQQPPSDNIMSPAVEEVSNDGNELMDAMKRYTQTNKVRFYCGN